MGAGRQDRWPSPTRMIWAPIERGNAPVPLLGAAQQTQLRGVVVGLQQPERGLVPSVQPWPPAHVSSVAALAPAADPPPRAASISCPFPSSRLVPPPPNDRSGGLSTWDTGFHCPGPAGLAASPGGPSANAEAGLGSLALLSALPTNRSVILTAALRRRPRVILVFTQGNSVIRSFIQSHPGSGGVRVPGTSCGCPLPTCQRALQATQGVFSGASGRLVGTQ